MRRCGSTPVSTIFIAYASTSTYGKEEVEAFYLNPENFYREGHVRREEKAAKLTKRHTTISGWDPIASPVGFWEDITTNDIDDEYYRLAEHLYDCARKAKSFKTIKRPLFPKTLELIRQREAARAAGKKELTSELERLCREAMKEDLKETRTKALAEAAEARKSINYAHRSFTNRETKTAAFRNPDGTTRATRKGMEKIIHNFYSYASVSHVHLPSLHLREDGYVKPEVRPPNVRLVIMSVKSCNLPGPDRIKSEHLKTLSPILINTVPGSSLVIFQNARFLSSGKPARPCCCIKRQILMMSATIAQSAYCVSLVSSSQERWVRM
ncbi:hypothetical protein RB195_023016 [Necator americanus]|uniref:Uncharacterized protein n=1 Tax=Necator americanus TaxID=51031 RepID=A0ABR1EHJ0_NECAM